MPNIAEIVADRDVRRPVGQRGLHVHDFAAQFVPHLRHLAGRRRGLQFDHDFRHAVPRLGRDLVDAAHRLDFAFDRFGDQLFDFFGRRSGIAGDDRRAFNDEWRVLLFAQLRESDNAADEQYGQEKKDNLAVVERVAG